MRPLRSRYEIPKDVKDVEDDWKGLIHRLKSHLSVIDSQTNSLEEDQSLGEALPSLDPAIVEALGVYVELVQLLHSQSPTNSPLS